MNGYRKNAWLAVLALGLGLGAVPFSYSEAQSSAYSFSAQECENVSNLNLENMNHREMELSEQCDMVEAAHDWEQQYGNLSEQELVAGIVNE